MPVCWTTLASGSSGNANYLDVEGRGVLLDVGLSPGEISERLAEAGADWSQLGGVVLTHTHADHWNAKTFELLLELQVPLYCHSQHRRELQLRAGEVFEHLQFAKLVCSYDSGIPFAPFEGVTFRPLPVAHDGGPTFGFRIDGGGDLFTPAWSIGFASDLGSWDRTLARNLADVNLLALEFNHDVDLQRNSRRPGWLKARVLGDHGHLSNVQAAHLLGAALRESRSPRLRHVVQLHLSRDCNHPDLAVAAASGILDPLAYRVHLQTATQDRPGATLAVSGVVAAESA